MRTLLGTVLAVLAGLLAPVALAAFDASDVLLDTDRWVETTAPVIEDEDARRALATVVVQRTSARLECDDGIVGRVASSGLGARARAGAVTELEAQLATERASGMWRDANRAAHAEFVAAARSDSIELDDRLLDAAQLVELAAAAIVVLDRADELLDDGGAETDECGGGGSALAIVDGDALRAAGLFARVLESASWLPAALGGASVALLVLALLIARRRLLALATFAAVAAALALSTFALREQLVAHLVDDIASESARELASVVIDRALATPLEHQQLLGLVVAACCVGSVLVAAWRASR